MAAVMEISTPQHCPTYTLTCGRPSNGETSLTSAGSAKRAPLPGPRKSSLLISAVCGIEVLPASLTVPGRRSCPGCVRWIAACQQGLLDGV
jgi:hypothetical protein